jgi:hypothetical protein
MDQTRERHKSKGKSKAGKSEGWWGSASGPIPVLNENVARAFLEDNERRDMEELALAAASSVGV